MKTFKNCAAQGDCYITRINALPAGAKLDSATSTGHYIIAHSETGHHHIISATPYVKYYTTDDPMVSYLEVVEATDKAEAVLEHLRSYDTHEAIAVPPGTYEIRRQREHTPEGWRRVED